MNPAPVRPQANYKELRLNVKLLDCKTDCGHNHGKLLFFFIMINTTYFHIVVYGTCDRPVPASGSIPKWQMTGKIV